MYHLIIAFLLGVFFAPNIASAAYSTVMSPNGGECLTVGVPYNITVSYDTAHVSLYFRSDGLQPTHLDASKIKHPLAATTYAWTPTSANKTETGRIWVDGHTAGHASVNVWDQSDANFVIRDSCIGTSGGGRRAHRPEIVLITPRGGSAFGRHIDITYEATDQNDADGIPELGLSEKPVSIFYAKSNFPQDRILIAKDQPAYGTYRWDTDGIQDKESYIITVRVEDASREVDEEQSDMIYIDKTAPQVEARSSQAKIEWATATSSFTFIEYGTKSGSYTRSTEINNTPSEEHARTIQNLDPGTTYYFRTISSASRKEPHAVSKEYTFTTPAWPAEVRNVFGFSGASSTVISWLNPDHQSFNAVQIHRRTDTFATGTTIATGTDVVYEGRATAFRDVDLTNGADYFYSLFAVDAHGSSSPSVNIKLRPESDLGELTRFSEHVDEHLDATSTEPAGPERVSRPSLLVLNDGLLLKWKNPIDPTFLGVHVVRGELSLPGTPYDGKIIYRGRAEEYKDTDISPSTNYYYGIYVFDFENNFSRGAFTAGRVPARELLTPHKALGNQWIKSSIEEYAEELGVLQSELASADRSNDDLVLTIRQKLSDFKDRIATFLIEIDPRAGEKITQTKDSIEASKRAEVMEAQKALSRFPSIYPSGLITGNYGPMTKEAVKKFQTQFNIVRPEERLENMEYGTLGKRTKNFLEKTQSAKIHTVRSTKEAYEPTELTIKKGDIVRWIIEENHASWPAIDEHPDHAGYPGEDYCSEYQFDACRDIERGEEYYFLFDKEGIWKYHDHVHPKLLGKIIVQ